MSEATTTRRRETTRQRLLDAAGEVFAEYGVDAASVEAICERAGFTRGAFYSNFGSKEELMLALTQRMAEHKLEQVTLQARALREDGPLLAPSDLVRRLLDAAVDRRAGVLLTSEIRTRAMRDPELAQAYLAWQQGMIERVAAVITELGSAYGFRLRLPAPEFARILLQTWEDAAAHAVIAGLPREQMSVLVNERTARLATALVDPT